MKYDALSKTIQSFSPNSAWESDDTEGVTQVTVAVGLETGEVLAPIIANQQETIQNLEAEADRKEGHIEDLEAENEQLRERLATIEDHLSLTSKSDQALPADD